MKISSYELRYNYSEIIEEYTFNSDMITVSVEHQNVHVDVMGIF